MEAGIGDVTAPGSIVDALHPLCIHTHKGDCAARQRLGACRVMEKMDSALSMQRHTPQRVRSL